MVRSIKVIAISILFIYCSLFLLANSPLHLYLFHRNGNDSEFDFSTDPYLSLSKAKSYQKCPLCEFLSLLLFRGRLCIWIALIAFCFALIITRYLTVHTPSINYYYALAPPATLS